MNKLTQEQSKNLNYNWLYEQRITNQLSFESIAKLLNCSVNPIKEACKKLNIPKVKYNESNALTNSFLRNKEWLYEEHVVKRRKFDDIAEEIKSHKATLSRWMSFHEIATNKSNSYERKHVNESKQQQELTEYIKSLGVIIETNNRSLLNGFEIDILIPSHKIAIEYNGVYSHLYRPEESNFAKRKDRNYHLSKTKKAKDGGYNLIHIFEDDWVLKKDIVKSIISSKLGTNSIIYARKCILKEINSQDKKIFLNNNHVQGNDKSSINLGLFLNNELYGVMTFCKSRYNKHYEWELSRYCSKLNFNIVGGFSKLLKYFRNINSGSIISYADRSRSNGDVYIKTGWKLIKTNPPGYHYLNLNKSIKRMHRSNFTKKKINCPINKTEAEYMIELGYHKIFDCGTLAFALY